MYGGSWLDNTGEVLDLEKGHYKRKWITFIVNCISPRSFPLFFATPSGKLVILGGMHFDKYKADGVMLDATTLQVIEKTRSNQVFRFMNVGNQHLFTRHGSVVTFVQSTTMRSKILEISKNLKQIRRLTTYNDKVVVYNSDDNDDFFHEEY